MNSYLQQFDELRKATPHMGLQCFQNENSPYCQYTERSRNCYMTFASYQSEDCYYNTRVFYCKNCTDCTLCNKCELCYFCLDCIDCYNSNYCVECQQCSDSAYCYFSVDLMNCFGCVSLKGKEYHIFNRPYSRDEYKQKVAELHKKPKEEIYAMMEELLKTTPRPASVGKKNTNSSGDHIYYCTNVYWGFDSKQIADSTYIYHCDDSKDLVDCSHLGWSENCYQIMSGGNLNNCQYCFGCWNSYNLSYCELVYNSHDCFFCVSLNKKDFHIFNKPYSEEDYKKEVARIIASLKESGDWSAWYPSTYTEVLTYGL